MRLAHAQRYKLIGKQKYKRIECPHCGLVGGDRNMKRYHFDNCKLKNDGDIDKL